MIEFDKVSKSYPGVQALANVSFAVAPASCHALLGENGAGKSTLGKILAGLDRPDSGSIRLFGQSVAFSSPRDAMLAGVGIVHQELVFCPDLSIAENLCLHELPRRGWRLDRQALRSRAEALVRQVELAVDVDAPLRTLSIAQEQLVQIASAVGLGAKILVFDEPTSSLGRAETATLFTLIRRLQAQGTTILYVSHRLEEIFSLCETATILRDGRHVATRALRDLTPHDVVNLMVGREIASIDLPTPPPESEKARVQLTNVSLRDRLYGVSLAIRPGEIVGLAGLVGAGRTELGETLAGLHPEYSGQIEVDGKSVRLHTVREAQRLGIGLIPEDRKRLGLIPGLSVRENTTLSILDRLRGRWGRLNRRRESAVAGQYRDRLRIRTPSLETGVMSLSGGNQQKVLFARGLATDCRVLVIDEPTRGVDIGAKREIHELIAGLAAAGTAILVISSDLPELLALSHRLIVLRAGRIVAQISSDEATENNVVAAMAGVESSAR